MQVKPGDLVEYAPYGSKVAQGHGLVVEVDANEGVPAGPLADVQWLDGSCATWCRMYHLRVIGECELRK